MGGRTGTSPQAYSAVTVTLSFGLIPEVQNQASLLRPKCPTEKHGLATQESVLLSCSSCTPPHLWAPPLDTGGALLPVLQHPRSSPASCSEMETHAPWTYRLQGCILKIFLFF